MSGAWGCPPSTSGDSSILTCHGLRRAHGLALAKEVGAEVAQGVSVQQSCRHPVWLHMLASSAQPPACWGRRSPQPGLRVGPPPTDTQQGQETPMLFWAWPFLQHRPTCPDQRSFRCREPHSKNHKGETSPGSVRRGVRRGPRERARLCAPACVKMHVMYEYTRVYVPECIHVCLRVHPLVCMCLCSHTCLYVCACMCLGLCVHTCTYVCACMTPMRVCV